MAQTPFARIPTTLTFRKMGNQLTRIASSCEDSSMDVFRILFLTL
jgi:hypothetical protein